MKSSVRSVSRSQINRPPSASSKTFPKPITGRRTGATVRWKLNERGRIANFDLKTLRGDIVRRLSCVDLPLYTLEECRTFLIELAATAAAWQEEEIPYLIYLSDLYEKLLPGEKFSYQWPPADADLFPSADMTLIEGGTLPMIAKVVEELNRSLVRMIDRIWDSRRDRLLFAAHLLQHIEPLLTEGHAQATK